LKLPISYNGFEYKNNESSPLKTRRLSQRNPIDISLLSPSRR
jgi:hypothetical protein